MAPPAFGSIGQQGVIDRSNYFLGDWSDINALRTDGVNYNIGNVQESALELQREEVQFVGTAFPRRLDLIFPSRYGMRFSGGAVEIHRALMHAVLNDTLTLWTSNYNYIGNAQCSVFQTIQGLRKRACDAQVIEFRIFKAFAIGNIVFGSGNDVIRVNFDWNALSDEDNTMGQGGSSSAPLGYLYLLSEASAVTTAS